MFQDFFAAEQVLHDETIPIANLLQKHAADPRWHAMLIFLFSGLLRSGSGVDGPVRRFGEVLRPRLKAEALGENPLPAILWGKCLELVNTQVDALGELGDEFFNTCLEALHQVEDPQHRLDLFDSLARLGLDRRKGVGLLPDGTPDIDWVEIPAGEFIYREEEEQQSIHLDRYYISRYPITNAQFQAFIDAGGYESEEWWRDIRMMSPKEPEWKLANRPKESVSWHEAVAFCRWLSQSFRVDIRLPTEQEWEKAARGADGREYPWGDGYLAGAANTDETREKIGPNKLDQTTAVGLYPQGSSPSGGQDMSGNVWEWCLNKDNTQASVEVDNSDDVRLLRGGSWFLDPKLAYSVSRGVSDPGIKDDGHGFRVLCSGPLENY
jgi:formylglycine-generating enzyme required for sulfatase activity